MKHVIRRNAQVGTGAAYLFVHSLVAFTHAIPDGLGGGCKFIDPQTTLKEGHCDGGFCTVDGLSHPSVIRGQLSI